MEGGEGEGSFNLLTCWIYMVVVSKAQNTVLEPFKDLLTFQISLDRPDFSVFKS